MEKETLNYLISPIYSTQRHGEAAWRLRITCGELTHHWVTEAYIDALRIVKALRLHLSPEDQKDFLRLNIEAEQKRVLALEIKAALESEISNDNEDDVTFVIESNQKKAKRGA